MLKIYVNDNWLCWYHATEMNLAIADFNYFANNGDKVRIEQNGKIIKKSY